MKPKDAAKDPKRDALKHGSTKARGPDVKGRKPTKDPKAIESEQDTKRASAEPSNDVTAPHDPARTAQPASELVKPSTERSAKGPGAPRRSQNEAHERELDAVKRLKSEPRTSKPTASERQVSTPVSRPAPLSSQPSASTLAPETNTGLERVVTSGREESSEERTPLEDRIARSADPRDLARMRTLADKVYQQGWNRLSNDEQHAFMYHARFLNYLSAQEKERADVQATMYRFVSAQGKSLGVRQEYSTRELNLLTDRFFGAINTPQNAPDLYRPLANTDYFKAERRR